MSKDKVKSNVQIRNKRASFEYEFLEQWTAGIMLTGTEIKSVRQHDVNLQDAYCVFLKGELWVKKLHISKYKQGTYYNHDPLRDRKLLLKKQELNKLLRKSEEKDLAIVPIKLFVNDRGYAKMEIALARGKKLYDKRESIKERDSERELARLKKI